MQLNLMIFWGVLRKTCAREFKFVCKKGLDVIRMNGSIILERFK